MLFRSRQKVAVPSEEHPVPVGHRQAGTAAGGRQGVCLLYTSRLLPPLVISQEEMDQGLEILKKTLS